MTERPYLAEGQMQPTSDREPPFDARSEEAGSACPMEETVPAPNPISGQIVLLATDGSPAAQAATAVTAELAARCGAAPTVVRAFGPASYVAPSEIATGAGIAAAVQAPEVLAAARDELAAQLAGAAGGPVAWPVRLLMDDPGSVVHAEAAAARATLPLLAPGAMLTLVYVDEGRAADALRESGEAAIHRTGVPAALARLRAQVQEAARAAGRTRVRVRSAVVEGAVAPALLAFAGRVGAEMIAVGSRRHGFMDRLMLGSVTTELLRAAGCSVLVVPHSQEDR